MLRPNPGGPVKRPTPGGNRHPNPGGPVRRPAPGGGITAFSPGGPRSPVSPLHQLSPGQMFNPFAPHGPHGAGLAGQHPVPASTVGDGYNGLQGIIDLLTHGVNQQQMDRISGGYNGTNGIVGHAGGHFAGLSPYAMHFLGTAPGLLTKVDNSVPTTDATGNPLTGSALLMANLQNFMGSSQPAQYKLADAITAQDLQQLFAGGIGGHSAYASGFNAMGRK